MCLRILAKGTKLLHCLKRLLAPPLSNLTPIQNHPKLSCATRHQNPTKTRSLNLPLHMRPSSFYQTDGQLEINKPWPDRPCPPFSLSTTLPVMAHGESAPTKPFHTNSTRNYDSREPTGISQVLCFLKCTRTCFSTAKDELLSNSFVFTRNFHGCKSWTIKKAER